MYTVVVKKYGVVKVDASNWLEAMETADHIEDENIMWSKNFTCEDAFKDKTVDSDE